MVTPDQRAVALISLQVDSWESGKDASVDRWTLALGGSNPDDLMKAGDIADILVAAVNTAAALVLTLTALTGVSVDELLAASLDRDGL